MVLTKEYSKLKGFRKEVRNTHTCPICQKRINIGIEEKLLQQLEKAQNYPYPHLHLHGEPLHAMLCYIDGDMRIRGISGIKSLEFLRDTNTLQQILRKWSNPY
ncbi:MAG: hypothetical protein GF317_13315 [Candidatus Lokiarchaeota archaeon]|nr:hypothetical protein [Candidatus Lokiarchaeota archaeon]MBD3200616.1 hypothetical protein [Candidatus Lokiarchaeota archaeon]